MKDQAVVMLLHQMIWLRIRLSRSRSDVPCGWCTSAAEQHAAKCACKGQLSPTQINTHLNRGIRRGHTYFCLLYSMHATIYKFVTVTVAGESALFDCCGSADSNVITSQTIQTEKCLTSTADGMPWSLADSLEEAFFRDAPQSSRAAKKSLLPVCQTLWVNSLTPEQNAPPHILMYLYFQSHIYSYNTDLPEQSFCENVCCLSAVQFTWEWFRIYPILTTI